MPKSLNVHELLPSSGNLICVFWKTLLASHLQRITDRSHDHMGTRPPEHIHDNDSLGRGRQDMWGNAGDVGHSIGAMGSMARGALRMALQGVWAIGM